MLKEKTSRRSNYDIMIVDIGIESDAYQLKKGGPFGQFDLVHRVYPISDVGLQLRQVIDLFLVSSSTRRH